MHATPAVFFAVGGRLIKTNKTACWVFAAKRGNDASGEDGISGKSRKSGISDFLDA
jgi:hypothetical protein